MSETRRFRCLNCGHRFECEVLSAEEKRDAERQNQRLFAIGCPECHRTDVRPGWE